MYLIDSHNAILHVENPIILFPPQTPSRHRYNGSLGCLNSHAKGTLFQRKRGSKTGPPTKSPHWKKCIRKTDRQYEVAPCRCLSSIRHPRMQCAVWRFNWCLRHERALRGCAGMNERLGHVEPDRTFRSGVDCVASELLPNLSLAFNTDRCPRTAPTLLRSSAAIEKADLPAACRLRSGLPSQEGVAGASAPIMVVSRFEILRKAREDNKCRPPL